jgi:hypothetical protein
MGRCGPDFLVITTSTSGFRLAHATRWLRDEVWVFEQRKEGVSFEVSAEVTIEECHVLGYRNPVRTSQETRYLSATEPNRLILCKISGFHGGDYDIYRLLRYKDPVCTSQETHYVSATEPSRLMLCKIWGFHSSDYEEYRLLGYKNPVHTSHETLHLC